MCYVDYSEPERPKGPKFVIKPKENMAYAVAKGNALDRFILLSNTSYVDEKFNVKEFKSDNDKKRYRPKSFWGAIWLGLPGIYKLMRPHLVWDEWITVPVDLKDSTKGIKTILFHRDENIVGLPIKTLNFGMFLTEMEDKNNWPFNLPVTLFIRCKNLQIMLFGNVDVYNQLRELTRKTIWGFVRDREFFTIGVEKEVDTLTKNGDIIKKTANELSVFICQLNDKIPGRPDEKGLREALGLEIEMVEMDSPILVGGEELLEASTKIRVEEINAKALVIKSKGIADGKKEEANGLEALYGVESRFLKGLTYEQLQVIKRQRTPSGVTLIEGVSKEPGIIITNK